MTDETYNQLEVAVRKQLKSVEKLDSGTKEGKEALDKAIALGELLVSVDKDNSDYYDKQERRRIEEEKNKAANKVESDKQKVTLGRACLELGKVVVPTVVSLFGYSKFQKRLMKFEETGRVTSTAGRELHLPRFM